MRKKIKYKLEEFAEIRRYAETTQRKEMIDQQVRLYLNKNCSMVCDWVYYYGNYKEMYKSLNRKV